MIRGGVMDSHPRLIFLFCDDASITSDDAWIPSMRDSQDRTFCLLQGEIHHEDGIGIGMRKP